MAERALMRTEDGVEIVGLWESPPEARAAVLLMHMMPAAKESWLPFMRLLARRGRASLAIDLRGHGESVRQGGLELDYRKFADEGHQAKAKDAEAAFAWILGQGFDGARVLVGGASIGANLAVALAAAHPEIPAAFALSPGNVYRGVDALAAVSRLSASQRLLIAASEEDVYSLESALAMRDARPAGETSVEIGVGLGHGTAMFERSPELADRVADWIVNVSP